ncbi:MAG: M50 family metallopeptidase [Syntrophomonadaceae bacterium]|jgi:stage IV sporulation protein FB
MKLGKIAGVTFRLNPLFFLLCFAYGYLGLLEEVLIIIASVLMHEIAHTVMALVLKVKVAEIELLPFGGQAKIEDFTGLDPEQEIYVAMAGPVLSLSLAAVFYFGVSKLGNIDTRLFVTFNIVLGCFNLLPALPLDGGRVLRAMCSTIVGYKKATQWAANLGKIIALVLIGGGSYLTYLHINNANYVVIGIFLYWAAHREARFLAYSFMRYLVNKKSELSRQGLLPSRQVVSEPQTLVKKILDSTRPTYYLIVVLVNENHEIIGMKTEAELIECLFTKGPRARLCDC